MALKIMLFSLPATVIYVHIYGHIGRRITVGCKGMDLRNIVREHPDTVVGHKTVESSMNVRKEVRRFSTDSLAELIQAIDDSGAAFVRGDVGRYLQAFSWYALSLERTIIQSSVARMCDSELQYRSRTRKYSPRQQQLAATELDNPCVHTS
jgi:hypothetical protein